MSLKISMTLESYDKQHVGREEDFRCALHRGLLSEQSRRMGHLCQCLLRVECEKTRYRNYVMSGRQLLGAKYRYQPLHQMAESTGYYCQH